MYQTFNMGMGLAIIVSKKDTEKTLDILKKYSESDVKIVGKIENGKGVVLKKLDIEY